MMMNCPKMQFGSSENLRKDLFGNSISIQSVSQSIRKIAIIYYRRPCEDAHTVLWNAYCFFFLCFELHGYGISLHPCNVRNWTLLGLKFFTNALFLVFSSCFLCHLRGFSLLSLELAGLCCIFDIY